MHALKIKPPRRTISDRRSEQKSRSPALRLAGGTQRAGSAPDGAARPKLSTEDAVKEAMLRTG